VWAESLLDEIKLYRRNKSYHILF